MQLKFGLAVCASVMLTACSSGSLPLEQWQTFSEQKVSAENLNQGESLVVFYREPNLPETAMDIFVNQDYQTSLLNGGFSAVTLCANQNFISASYRTNQAFGNRTSGVHFYSPSQQATYVKLIGTKQGELAFEFVPEQEGRAAVDRLKYQANVLSRVVTKPCAEQNYVRTTLHIPFGFDKSGKANLSGELTQAINHFAENLGSNIQQVRIDGYADPVGASSYNQQLSLKRASTVAKLVAQIKPELKLEINGYGETNLHNPYCQQQFKGSRAQINQCNVANRRVEITAFGQQ